MFMEERFTKGKSTKPSHLIFTLGQNMPSENMLQLH